ncbi:PAS domain-containing protein [Alginatibacterium sediminis]|uniref:PAS domain-containing protein n=1 Tax=Alginatibacterium sediminis TaxID=2164068 RepID=A0A420EI20_9ALTE|nr:PAS domain-containing protein [Alginatibacterium sediminis]RKF20345.1 PAS domain-containing protein [Alginatibacterium sediminis]
MLALLEYYNLPIIIGLVVLIVILLGILVLRNSRDSKLAHISVSDLSDPKFFAAHRDAFAANKSCLPLLELRDALIAQVLQEQDLAEQAKHKTHLSDELNRQLLLSNSQIFEATPSAMMIIDEQLQVLDINQCCLRQFGLKKKHSSLNLSRLLDASKIENLKEQCKTVLESPEHFLLPLSPIGFAKAQQPGVSYQLQKISLQNQDLLLWTSCVTKPPKSIADPQQNVASKSVAGLNPAGAEGISNAPTTDKSEQSSSESEKLVYVKPLNSDEQRHMQSNRAILEAIDKLNSPHRSYALVKDDDKHSEQEAIDIEVSAHLENATNVPSTHRPASIDRAHSSHMPQPLLDEGALKKALQGLEKPLQSSLISLHSHEMRQSFRLIERQLQNQDFTAVHIQARAIAGIAQHYGLAQIAQHCEQFENISEATKDEQKNQMIADFAKTLDESISQLNQERSLQS